jgi:hypothetical protein
MSVKKVLLKALCTKTWFDEISSLQWISGCISVEVDGWCLIEVTDIAAQVEELTDFLKHYHVQWESLEGVEA